jgi:hypothetical protein
MKNMNIYKITTQDLARIDLASVKGLYAIIVMTEQLLAVGETDKAHTLLAEVMRILEA